MKVKVVEDNEDIAWLVGTLLEDLGEDQVEVITRNFESLFKASEWEDVDVALIDFMLVGLTGLDILRYLAGEHPKIRRVLFTAIDPANIDKRAIDLADDVLTKPATGETIRRAIRGHNHGH